MQVFIHPTVFGEADGHAARQTWLTSAFTKFSTKSRGGKGSDIWQPPHTIKFRGKCDLEIGPHVFYATSVYEVTYQPYSAPAQASLPYHTQKGVASASHTPPMAVQSPPVPTHSTGAHVYAPSTTALVSSLKGAVPITSDLIAQVNAAAMSNPTLANLLGLAASGSATSEQLQTLGVTIQSLADTATRSANVGTQPQPGPPALAPLKVQSTTSSHPPVPPPAFVPPASKTSVHPPVLSLRPPQTPPSNPTPGESFAHQQVPQVMQTIHRDPDVVIEFYENSYDRWTLPKELVLYERVKRWDGNSSLADIIFSTIFPFEGSKPTTIPLQSNELPLTPNDVVHPITLRFFNVPPAIWNLFSQAAGDEGRTEHIKVAIDHQVSTLFFFVFPLLTFCVLFQLDTAASRAYLQHRISDGSLLSQLQAVCSIHHVIYHSLSVGIVVLF